MNEEDEEVKESLVPQFAREEVLNRLRADNNLFKSLSELFVFVRLKWSLNNSSSMSFRHKTTLFPVFVNSSFSAFFY